ncbi:MAG: gas vesicle protein [Parachlamydiaceae bacterium]
MGESSRVIACHHNPKEQLSEELEPVTLCEVLDRILNKGVVVMGEVTLSVANIDLIYLNVQLLLTTIDRAQQLKQSNPIDQDET